MPNLLDLRATLEQQLARSGDLPCHVHAFCAWIVSDTETLSLLVKDAVGVGQIRHTEHVAALGYGAASALLEPAEIDILRDEIAHLSGRMFFVPGRPLQFEIDGVALLGVSLGVTALGHESNWLQSLLSISTVRVTTDAWQIGLVGAAQRNLGTTVSEITPPDLGAALMSKGVGDINANYLRVAWEIITKLEPHNSGPARDAARVAAFEYILRRMGQINISAFTRDDLISLLRNISRSMRMWTFESEKRTPRSEVTKWSIENEYHVQNLLWAILAPVLSDLENEENLPSIGHKSPRADLGVPSLRTIVEVKFMRRKGQQACAKIIEEIAADASLYLSKSGVYDSIIAFVWDDVAQTEQHDELKSGLEAIKGVCAAIVLSRPAKMERENGAESF